ncbi:MAG TPA: FAD-dependent oxidoreductase [Patescibacteria group bacterium]|nr:FAD-dependent oxidoreductase [Patescibacteria group bacterium]
MAIETHQITLLSKKEIAKDTMLFSFAKPDNFAFIAGQYVVFGLINPAHTDKRPSFRSLSIATAPSDDTLEFSMRSGVSAFKRSLWELPIGGVVEIKGPLGRFVFPADPMQPVVFLVGGIGITPVRSMLREELHKKSTRPIALFYSNNSMDTAAFCDEWRTPAQPSWKNILTMTDSVAVNVWDGECGFITEEMITRHLSDPHAHHYYIVGPGNFVTAMQDILEHMNIDNTKVTVDNFGVL